MNLIYSNDVLMHYFIFSNFFTNIIFNIFFILRSLKIKQYYFIKSTNDTIFFLFFKKEGEDIFFMFNLGYPNFIFLF